MCCANRSLAQARAGHLLRALRDAQRAVALAPAYAPAHRRVGAVLRQLGRHHEARRAMATATLLAGRSCTPTRLAREHWCETTPSFPARAGAISSTADRGDEEASALDLDWLGAALARGKERHEMSLAVRCASFLGPPPWKLPQAVSIHRRLGAPSYRSTAVQGAILPLKPEQVAAAKALLEGLRASRAAAMGPDGLPDGPPDVPQQEPPDGLPVLPPQQEPQQAPQP